jgi:hypothetical protein
MKAGGNPKCYMQPWYLQTPTRRDASPPAFGAFRATLFCIDGAFRKPALPEGERAAMPEAARALSHRE